MSTETLRAVLPVHLAVGARRVARQDAGSCRNGVSVKLRVMRLCFLYSCIDCSGAEGGFQAQLSAARGDCMLSVKRGRSRCNPGTISAVIRANLFAAHPPSAQDGATLWLVAQQ